MVPDTLREMLADLTSPSMVAETVMVADPFLRPVTVTVSPLLDWVLLSFATDSSEINHDKVDPSELVALMVFSSFSPRLSDFAETTIGVPVGTPIASLEGFAEVVPALSPQM